ncbi:MAG: universal stress protein [Spirochaetales bacterium]|nr:universal stress protein [Spirochaetales bacterium]
MDGPVKRILVYIDGTEQTITAAQYAICLCRATGAQLFALYVVNTRALSDLVKSRIFLSEEQDEYRRDIEADAEKYLTHVRNLARRKGLVIETLNVSGTVHQEIKNKIAELDIDLLVLGELSRIRSRRDELYNESERAMRNVPCSVLIVKDEDRVWEIFDKLV